MSSCPHFQLARTCLRAAQQGEPRAMALSPVPDSAYPPFILRASPDLPLGFHESDTSGPAETGNWKEGTTWEMGLLGTNGWLASWQQACWGHSRTGRRVDPSTALRLLALTSSSDFAPLYLLPLQNTSPPMTEGLALGPVSGGT